jgi:hypothetical protein
MARFHITKIWLVRPTLRVAVRVARSLRVSVLFVMRFCVHIYILASSDVDVGVSWVLLQSQIGYFE